jgi:hypothetical protein
MKSVDLKNMEGLKVGFKKIKIRNLLNKKMWVEEKLQ